MKIMKDLNIIVLRVILADPQTGAVKEERFFRNKGEDDEGTYGQFSAYGLIFILSLESLLLSGEFARRNFLADFPLSRASQLLRL